MLGDDDEHMACVATYKTLGSLPSLGSLFRGCLLRDNRVVVDFFIDDHLFVQGDV